MKKRLICLLLAAALALSLTACGTATDEKTATASEQTAAAETKPAQEAAPAETESAETASEPEAVIPTEPNGITLIHAETADGTTFLAAEAGATVSVQAILEDADTAVDHWEFNGEVLDASEAAASVEISLDEAGTLAAVLRPVRKVEGVNCHLQLLDAEGIAAGDTYTELYFEEAYENPVTGETCEGGTISLCVTADIPDGQTVDYWLINGVRYDFGSVAFFTVENLDEATVYEPVFETAAHVHNFQMFYSTEQHWRCCKGCGAAKDYGPHNFVETVVYNSDGSAHMYTETCSVCGYSYSQTIIY